MDSQSVEIRRRRISLYLGLSIKIKIFDKKIQAVKEKVKVTGSVFLKLNLPEGLGTG